MNKISFQYWKYQIKENAAIFAFVILVIATFLWTTVNEVGDKTLEAKIIKGKLTGFHQTQKQTDLGYPVFVALLNNGTKAQFSPPIGTPFHKNKEILILKETKESGRVIYSFNGYPNKTANKVVKRDQ